MLARPRIFALAALMTAISLPAAAGHVAYRSAGEPNQLRFRIGNFEPDGNSQYWLEKELDFTGDAADFDDLVAAIEYRRALGGRLALVVSGSGYEGELSQAYLDFEDQAGRDIAHTTFLEIATGTVGLAWNLTGPSARLQPYVGGGVGFWDWRLEESGDFIGFGIDFPSIFTDTFVDQGTAFGWYFSLGLDVPITDAVSIFGEARWDDADDELSGDFEGLGLLDLSGRQMSIGFAVGF